MRVGAAVSEDVVTSTRLFAIRYTITSLASARPPDGKGHPFDHDGHIAASTVVALHEAGSFTLHILHRFDVLLCRRILHDGSDKRLVT